MNFSEFSHGKFEMVFIVAWLSRLKYTFDGPTLCLTKCPFPWSLEEQGSTGVKWDSLQRFYCRVSTADQTCARQERDLRAFAKKAGYKVAGVWKETASGTKDERGADE